MYVGWLFNDTVRAGTNVSDDRMITECAAVGGIKIGRGKQSTLRKPGLIHHKSHIN
jgi:hypothetical protein